MGPAACCKRTRSDDQLSRRSADRPFSRSLKLAGPPPARDRGVSPCGRRIAGRATGLSGVFFGPSGRGLRRCGLRRCSRDLGGGGCIEGLPLAMRRAARGALALCGGMADAPRREIGQRHALRLRHGEDSLGELADLLAQQAVLVAADLSVR